MINRYFAARTPPRGTLIYEFPVSERTATSVARWIDAVILMDEPTDKPERIIDEGEPIPPVDGKRVVIIQAKTSRLGMSLMGQALFSIALMEAQGAKVVKSVALCSKGDSVLEALLRETDSRLEAVAQLGAPEDQPSEV